MKKIRKKFRKIKSLLRRRPIPQTSMASSFLLMAYDLFTMVGLELTTNLVGIFALEKPTLVLELEVKVKNTFIFESVSAEVTSHSGTMVVSEVSAAHFGFCELTCSGPSHTPLAALDAARILFGNRLHVLLV